VWSIGAKVHVNQTARQSLNEQGIAHQRLLTVPAPFNTLLWRVLAMDDDGYHEGFYSLLDDSRTIRFSRYNSNPALLEGLTGHWPVKRLQWFTHGFYAVQDLAGSVVITDLRMGLEPYYVFRFKVGEISNPHARPTKNQRVHGERGLDRLAWVWKRIWEAEPASS
jgi:inner membrane protein